MPLDARYTEWMWRTRELFRQVTAYARCTKMGDSFFCAFVYKLCLFSPQLPQVTMFHCELPTLLSAHEWPKRLLVLLGLLVAATGKLTMSVRCVPSNMCVRSGC